MPPKKVADGGIALTQGDLDFVIIALKEVETMEVNWRAVAAAQGIARHDNAIARFNVILKKLGCKLVKGQIISLDEAAAGPSEPTTPIKPVKGATKPPKTPKTPKTPASGRKRKAKEVDPDTVEEAVDAEVKKTKVEGDEKAENDSE